MEESPLNQKRGRLLPSIKRRLALRQEFWPEINEKMLWNRRAFNGFTYIPRTLPIIILALNNRAKKRLGDVYLDLWCRSFDDMVIDVRDEHEAAFSSGFSGSRGIAAWRERIAGLEELGFIRCARNLSHGLRYVLLLDPHPVMEELNGRDVISPDIYDSYRHLMLQIGARDAELNTEDV